MTTSTPSQTTTAGQIDKAVSNYRALLEKHSREFSSEAVQVALGQPKLAEDQLVVFRKHVEALSDPIVRRVTVNRARSLKEAIDATGREQYLNNEVVTSAPRGNSDEVEVIFFKLGRYVSDAELEKEFDLRDLTPVDPHSLTAINQADPTFADNHPNGTHWQDADKKWCYAAFGRYVVGRDVRVLRGGGDWNDSWWFAGVRKVSK